MSAITITRTTSVSDEEKAWLYLNSIVNRLERRDAELEARNEGEQEPPLTPAELTEYALLGQRVKAYQEAANYLEREPAFRAAMTAITATPTLTPAVRLTDEGYRLDRARRDPDYEKVAADARCVSCRRPGLAVSFFLHPDGRDAVVADCPQCQWQTLWP